jgi:uncharacterized membrane protein YeaQ/YmgE (transglycosylase-associated protein family)
MRLMQMELIDLTIQIVCGAIGGHAAAAMFRDKSLGAPGNTLAGLIGGIAGAQGLIRFLGKNRDEVSHVIQQVAGAGTGGALMMATAGFAWFVLRSRRRN